MLNIQKKKNHFEYGHVGLPHCKDSFPVFFTWKSWLQDQTIKSNIDHINNERKYMPMNELHKHQQSYSSQEYDTFEMS